jgi:hypothetical protein
MASRLSGRERARKTPPSAARAAPADYCSSRFRRAVIAERKRLVGQLDPARRAVSEVRAQLSSAEEHEGSLRARIALLTALLGGEPPESDGPLTAADNDRLRGRAIREIAVRVLLWRQRAPGSSIHYRDWLSLVEEAGYRVAGKRPDAVFLNQVTRSPVVKATTRAGYYEVDVEAPKRLMAELQRLRTSLSAAADQDTAATREPDPAQTRGVLLSISRVQRALKEAEDALRDAPPPARLNGSEPPLAG